MKDVKKIIIVDNIQEATHWLHKSGGGNYLTEGNMYRIFKNDVYGNDYIIADNGGQMSMFVIMQYCVGELVKKIND